MRQLVDLAIFAVLSGIAVLVTFAVLGTVLDRFPPRWADRLRPYQFIGPALGLITVFFVYPTARTVSLSLYDAAGANFVGLANYVNLAQNGTVRTAIVNSAVWTVLTPLLCVVVGLTMAVLADRLSPRWESAAKSVIFLPLAISFVGAGTIWRFVYDYRPSERGQVGLLNNILVALGGEPQPFLAMPPLNNLLLIVVFVWMQSGFAMVLLSAAIKQVPHELLEAARLDGASEWQVFRRVVVPEIGATMAVVLSAIGIVALKVFDVVYAMTNGNFGTEVIANRFFKETFQFRQFGSGAALAVVLMILCLPFIVVNVRRYWRASEGS